MENSATSGLEALHARVEAARAQNPNLRARDLAAALSLSEAELVAAGLGRTAVRLAPDWAGILKAMEEVGPVMALTRNEAVVHEKVGRYAKMEFGPHGGIVLNHDIDLRLFFANWKFGFEVREETRSGPRRSLQFFDAAGTAVHKIYAREESDAAALDALVARFRHEDQDQPIAVAAPAPAPAPAPDEDVDSAGFLAAWASLKDTHDFFPLLKKYGVSRLQALRFAEGSFAQRAPRDAATRVLETAARSGVPIMVFAGNHGCIQIHTGPVSRIEPRGPWINVLDEGFNLHLRTDLVAEAWVVRKPTVDGDVTSIEVYDAQGGLLVQFFGERKPGKPELESWRDLIAHGVLGQGVAA